MVERFNGRIAEILQTTRFDSSKDLRQTLLNYRDVYNHHIPQKALGHITPVQALKQWQKKRPEIFVKRVYNHAGLDTYKEIGDKYMAKNKIELSVSRDDPHVAYISLPKHPGSGTPGIVSKQVRLREIIKDYKGIDILIDFDKDGEAIGIEIVG